MNKHELRLTWLFLLYGIIAVAGYSFGLPQIIERFAETNSALYSMDGLTKYQWTLITTAVSHAVFVFYVGVYSYIKKSAFHSTGLIAAITSIIFIPVGTVIGVYYLYCRSEHTKLSLRAM